MPHLSQRDEGLDPRQQPAAHIPRGRRRPITSDPRAIAGAGFPHEHQNEPQGVCWTQRLGTERVGLVHWRPMGRSMG